MLTIKIRDIRKNELKCMFNNAQQVDEDSSIGIILCGNCFNIEDILIMELSNIRYRSYKTLVNDSVVHTLEI